VGTFEVEVEVAGAVVVVTFGWARAVVAVVAGAVVVLLGRCGTLVRVG
jgi:hypothetical protein